MIFSILIQPFLKSADSDSAKRTVEPRSLNGSLKRQKSKPISGLVKVMINWL